MGSLARLAGSAAFLLTCVACISIRLGPPTVIETDAEKVRRSLAELRAIATALEAYAVDNNSYPRLDGADVPVGNLTFGRVSSLLSFPLVYRRGLATFDPWGFPYLYWTDGQHWSLIYTGSDGKIRDPAGTAREIETYLSTQMAPRPHRAHCLEDDIILIDSVFLTWPANDTTPCSTR